MSDEGSGPIGPEPSGPRQQYAALPYRARRGELIILLISSRETRRWVIPKGWPMKKREPPDAAAREAWEEAGVQGDVERAPIGCYSYMKRLADGSEVLCVVDVFPLKVRQEEAHWREQDQRTRRWFAPVEAAEAVDEPELKALIRAFAERRTARR